MSNGSVSNTKRLRKTQETSAIHGGTSVQSRIYSRFGDEVIIPLQEAMHEGKNLAGGSLSSEQRKLVEGMIKHVSVALQRGAAYFDLLRLDAGELILQVQSLDLEDVIAKAVQSATGSAKAKGITLVAERSHRPLPPVDADEARLLQILGNLLDNAIKFTDRGQVTVSTEIYDRSVAVHVVDTGAGIAADVQPRLFEDFFQRETGKVREVKRAGLGLTLSRRLVIRMGGDFWVSSTVGAGSRFSFTVPRSVDAAGRPRAVTT